MIEGTLDLKRSRPAASTPSARPHDSGLPPQLGWWQRLWATPAMMHYHRLIALVGIVNAAILVFGAGRGGWEDAEALTAIANLTTANLALAIVIRQQYVINLLFKAATSVPRHWPLSIRRVMGKVYHFGGLHVGGAVFGSLWFAAWVGVMTVGLANGRPVVSAATAGVSYALLAVLAFLIVMALPAVRSGVHDRFERAHRFGGWAALALFWAQTLLFVDDLRGAEAFGRALLAAPGFWMLLLITASIALPWMRLKKVPVRIEKPSPHVALVRFDYGVTPFAGSSTTVSRSPLLEWHSFANVPAPGQDGFRLTISRAGDWTGSFIDDLPSHLWVKGIPTAGVGNIDRLFNRVVWVATGSGIGPTLPHLLYQLTPARLVWSTRAPRETYGDALVDEILKVEPDALIWDTNADGRPDLVTLAYQAYREFEAEAVICISNKELTWEVVYGMESRGIPAYGAIWDS